MNVITGHSQTGKSALIPIIDYCLASDKCSIPTDTIRLACSWFGVVFDTAVGQILLARREPGQSAASNDMHVVQAPTVVVSDTAPEPTIQAARVREILNELAGLTDLQITPDAVGSTFKSRPAFRDMVSFNFQPQNIVANPNVLFYKADSFEGREKLRAVFPFVLNAIDAESLAKLHELNRLRQELRRKQKDLDGLRQVSARWSAEARAKVMTAVELGLTSPPPAQADFDDLLQILRNLVDVRLSDSVIRLDNLDAAAQELGDLQREESGLSADLTFLRSRLAEMNRLRNASEYYEGSIAVRRDRLSIATWMKDLVSKESECPICGSQQLEASSEVAALVDALASQEAQAGSAGIIPATFDREYQRVHSIVDETVERLNATRIRRRALEASSEQAKRSQFQALSAARFLGSIEQAIVGFESVSSDSDLSAEVDALRQRVAELQTSTSEGDVQRSLDRSKAHFQDLVKEILPGLNAERSDPVQLVPEELTLKIIGNNREDFLWEVGSGANWVSYHVAALVAIHRLLLSLPKNPVPTFLVFDQPSQAYFPRQMDERAPVRDADVIAVRRIYAALAKAVSDSGGKLQITVIDHADKATWGGIPLTQVADWHDGEKLVPAHWITEAPPQGK